MRIIFVLLFLPFALFSQPTPELLVHEAFISYDQNNIVLETVPLKPPAEISERIPVNTIPNAVWIPGYWSWLGDHFIWRSGTWRVPPPGHEWVPCKWKQFDDGWVRLKGFWTFHDVNNLVYLSQPPPDNVDENVQDPLGEGYFWIPGHWSYSQEKNDFIWFKGRWHEWDAKWQYAPARYVWREKGYIFIDGFWDWNLDSRGIAYAAVNIPEDEIDTLAYLPEKVVEAKDIMRTYYPYWPDYFISFQHWSFFHPGFDFGYGAVPTWWNFPSWWSFNCVDLWSLWWWWTHPTFPHPFFITEKLSTMILPPDAKIVQRMKDVKPKPFIARNGVTDVLDLIRAIKNYTHHGEPIMPLKPSEVFEIQENAHPTKRPSKVLRPTGVELPLVAPPKPFFGPSITDFSQPVQNTPVLSYPQGIMKPPLGAVMPVPPVVPRTRTYETDYVEPASEVLPSPRTIQDPPHLYLPRNNTRLRPPYPESYKPRSPYTPRNLPPNY